MTQLEIKSLETKQTYTIYINRQGENNMPCPECSKDRKPDNQKKKSFSWNTEKETGYCQNCSASFVKKNTMFEKEKQYVKPEKKNFTKLKDEHLQWFSKRGLNQDTVNAFKLVSENDLIIFPYIKNNELVNVKKRSMDKKTFLQGKDCEQIMFNYDNCIDEKELIIVEGEIDCMSYFQAGFKNVTSVSQGAPNPNDRTTDKKLECITNCYELFENKEKIYIHTDNDINGITLRKELIRRLGAEKCFIINELMDCKDANDIILKYGIEKLIEGIKNSVEAKVDGVISIYDTYKDIIHDYHNGQNRGTTTYFQDFDKHYTWRAGEVTIWTGYNNEGKSTFLRYLQLCKSCYEGTRWAFFAPEDYPSKDFYTDLVHAFVGKSVDKCYLNVMSEDELIDAMDSIRDWFYLVDPVKEKSIEAIFELFTFLVKRKGIDGITIDPYNQIEHIMKHGEREDLYISRFMSQLKRFAINNNIIVNLVAHQVTPEFGRGDKTYPKPNIYRIKGGGTFADKADNVISVWRPNRFNDRDDPTVLVESQKIKKQRLVGIPGEVYFEFSRVTNRYYIDEQTPLNGIIR
jgi:twinkle protein